MTTRPPARLVLLDLYLRARMAAHVEKQVEEKARAAASQVLRQWEPSCYDACYREEAWIDTQQRALRAFRKVQDEAEAEIEDIWKTA